MRVTWKHGIVFLAQLRGHGRVLGDVAEDVLIETREFVSGISYA